MAKGVSDCIADAERELERNHPSFRRTGYYVSKKPKTAEQNEHYCENENAFKTIGLYISRGKES